MPRLFGAWSQLLTNSRSTPSGIVNVVLNMVGLATCHARFEVRLEDTCTLVCTVISGL